MTAHCSRTIGLAFLALLAVPAGGDLAPQPPMRLSKGQQGTFNADWEGVAGRTYFTQFSLNLTDWHYAPFIDFGEESHHRGIESDAERLFFRLHYGDFPGVDSLDDAMNADFDGDGLTNIFELTNGLNPFSTTNGGDEEEDGLLLGGEQQYGTSPQIRDHPAVGLSVTITN